MEESLKAGLKSALLKCVRARTTITYRDLVAEVRVPPPHGIHKTTLALEDLIREDHAAGRPLLAALAVSRGNNGLPGHGFFHLLVELGRYDGPDRGTAARQAFERECEAALDYWSKQT